MKVKDVMHKGAECVSPDTSIMDIAKLMRDEDVGSVPICDKDRLTGMVTDRDIVCRGLAAGRDCNALTAADVMTKPIVYCRVNEDVEDALRLMEKNQIRRLPVIDDNKRLCGMLAIGDISSKVNRTLTGEVMQSVATHHA